MFNPRFPAAFVLAATLLFASCDNNEVALKSDATPVASPMTELAARWNTRSEDAAAIQATVKAYRDLPAKELDAFNEADIKYKIDVLGQNAEYWQLQLQARRQANQLAQQQHQVGYNRLPADQKEQMLKQVYSQPAYAALKSLQAANDGIVSTRSARTSTLCNSSSITSGTGRDCNFPLRSAFADPGAYVADVASSASICSFKTGIAHKNGQNDCDYFVRYQFTLANGVDPHSRYRALFCATPEIANLVNEGIGIFTIRGTIGANYTTYYKHFLFGDVSTDQIGGIKYVADNMKLNPRL